MKKLLAILLLSLSCILLQGQGKVTTKKMKISDFTAKTTKIVLSGNPVLDAALHEEMYRRWRISPFDFCTYDEFKELKKSDRYYFLQLLKVQYPSETEPGISFLSLFKGGEEDITIVDIPFCPASFPSGRELFFLPAMLDIIQNFTLEAMNSDVIGYKGLKRFSKKLALKEEFNVYISRDDLEEGISEDLIQQLSESGLIFSEGTEADDIMLKGNENSLISYVVAPFSPSKGSFFFKLLISSDKHELYYFRKVKVKKDEKTGFNPSDLKTIALTKQ